LLKFKTPEPLQVEVEGQTVFVHALNAGEFALVLSKIEQFKKNNEAHKADFYLLMVSIKDAEGKCVFDSIEEAMDIPISVASALLPVCLRVNGMGQHLEKKDSSETTTHA
jgi:hypothetical protein